MRLIIVIAALCAAFATSTAAHALPHVMPHTSPMEALFRDDMEKRARMLAQDFGYTREQQQAIIKVLTDEAPDNGTDVTCGEYAGQSARFAVESAPSMSDAAEHNIGQLAFDLCMLKSPEIKSGRADAEKSAADAAALSASPPSSPVRRHALGLRPESGAWRGFPGTCALGRPAHGLADLPSA